MIGCLVPLTLCNVRSRSVLLFRGMTSFLGERLLCVCLVCDLRDMWDFYRSTGVCGKVFAGGALYLLPFQEDLSSVLFSLFSKVFLGDSQICWVSVCVHFAVEANTVFVKTRTFIRVFRVICSAFFTSLVQQLGVLAACVWNILRKIK